MDSVSVTNSESKTPRVIVSLTTYPGRIDRVHKTIDTLIRQTVKADMIVLWLAEEQFPDGENSLPAELLAQKDSGLHIEWCSDIKSYKKIIPAAEKWQDDIIITADDDIIYELNTIERLLKSYEKHPGCVSTLRTHLMLFDDTGMPLPYDQWKPEYSGFIDQPLMALFPTTGAGTLFPPGILPEEAFDRDTFMSICPKADDVWIKCMLTLAGVPVVLADTNTKLQYVEGTQQETLYSYNRSGNDQQLSAVIERYNDIGGDELPDDTLLIRMNDLSDYTPDDGLCQKYRKGRSFVNEKLGVKVSVVMIGYNCERQFIRCLRSAQAQSMEDIEIICVNNGSDDGTGSALQTEAEKDGRIRIITLPERVSPIAARREAVLNSVGEYFLFPDVSGILAPDACEQLYTRAEDADADILAFTAGELSSGEAQAVFDSVEGRIRNKDIVSRLFTEGGEHSCRLSRGIFGGRLCRKAYLHADEQPTGGDLYEFFLLCRCAEVYVGEQTQIYYAFTPGEAVSPMDNATNTEAIDSFIAFAHAEEQLGKLAADIRRRLILSDMERCMELTQIRRASCFEQIHSAWGAASTAAGLTMMNDIHGESILREISELPCLAARAVIPERIGVIVGDPAHAREMFITTELLDCIAPNCPVVFIGADKSDAAHTVKSAKAEYAGAELAGAEDALEYAVLLDALISEHKPDALVLWTGSENYVPTAVQARLSGIAVIAAMTEPLCTHMLSCSRPAAGITALRLANVTVTDSPAQQRLLDALGIRAKYIPRPTIRLMGGRSSRAAANAVIVWSGSAADIRFGMNDAIDIFRRVRSMLPNVHMQMYLDGSGDPEQLSADMPDGITLRRLRPDYGIFSDAAVQLITGTAGTTSETLRAGRTMGVPAVMYRPEGEQENGMGAVIVQPCDKESASAEIVRLLSDKSLREQLGAQGKISTGGCELEEVARRWGEVLNELDTLAARPNRLPTDEMGCALSAAMTGYEDGAKLNADRLESFRQRGLQYEQQLADAEQQRVTETGKLGAEIEKLRAQLREKEQERRQLADRLEDVQSSTIYKAGSVLTYIPRSIKKLISRIKGNEE